MRWKIVFYLQNSFICTNCVPVKERHMFEVINHDTVGNTPQPLFNYFIISKKNEKVKEFNIPKYILIPEKIFS